MCLMYAHLDVWCVVYVGCTFGVCWCVWCMLDECSVCVDVCLKVWSQTVCGFDCCLWFSCFLSCDLHSE